MLSLKEETKKNIAEVTGLPVKRISSISPERLDEYLAKKIGKKIEVCASLDSRIKGRGCIYLSTNRLKNKTELDNRLSKI